MSSRVLTVAAIQTGPASDNKSDNIAACLRLLDEAAQGGLDFAVLPELALTPYFPTGGRQVRFYEWAEPVPGPATERFSDWARDHACGVVLPLFEKGSIEGHYYNSAVVIDRNGEVVPGCLPDGRTVKCARKSHPALVDFEGFNLNEAIYMRAGEGYPIFLTDKAKVGVIICYDRWFPEAWRSLALAGAEIVFVLTASCYGASGGGGEIFPWSHRVWAHQNLLFAAAANKAGIESVEREITYYGLSCVVHPSGMLLAQGPEAEGPAIVKAECDLDDVAAIRRGMPYFRDRRNDIDVFFA